MLPRHLAIMTLAAFLLAPGLARAQDGTVRIAVCNLTQVFQKLDESKVIQDRLIAQREKITMDSRRMEGEVKSIQQALAGLKPGSSPYLAKNAELTEKIIRYEVWARQMEAEVQRTEKDFLKALHDKIRDATKEVAEKRKIDLVLNERRPDLGDMERYKPNEVRALILQNDVLYMNQKADITDDVILVMNQKFAQAGTAAAPKP